MKKIYKIWVAALLAALLAMLCGCSADEFTLPTQVDMQPGETCALATLLRYTGAEELSTADAAALAALVNDVENVTIEFTSTAPGVVRVDKDGVMTAGRPGDATVVVHCAALDYYTEVQVTVATLPETLSTTPRLLLAQGDTYQLETAVQPYGSEATVLYTSADETVATVDAAGTVTAIAPGETAVTAQVAGSSLSAVCSVSVAGEDAVQSITMTRAGAELTPGQTLLLGVHTTPTAETGDQTVAWQSSENAVATVDESGFVTAIGSGTAEISATIGGKKAVCRLTVLSPATTETATPETATPETATPESATPEAATPETATPETATPETATPETAEMVDIPLEVWGDDHTAATPESATPETAIPETATPETATPESATPETATPETGLQTGGAMQSAADTLADWLQGAGKSLSGFLSGLLGQPPAEHAQNQQNE